MYSRDDIKNAIINGKLKIHPFNEKSLTGIVSVQKENIEY